MASFDPETFAQAGLEHLLRGPILASPRTLNVFRMNAPERFMTAASKVAGNSADIVSNLACPASNESASRNLSHCSFARNRTPSPRHRCKENEAAGQPLEDEAGGR